MANDAINPQPGSFGIEDTMEIGAGNLELLKDLVGDDGSGGDPDKLEDIVKHVDDQPEGEEPAPAKKKEPVVEKKKDDATLYKFLQDGKEDEEEEEEPAEPKEKIAKAAEPGEEPEPEPVETSQFGALSKDLFKLGVFTLDEDEDEPEISNPEEFLERFNNEKRKGAIEVVNNFIGQFGEDYQRAFDAIFVKGVDPRQYFTTYESVVNFAELDITKEENQVTVMRKALADQGFEPEDIDTEIERLRNYGDLESVSGKHHKVLVKREATKLRQMEEEAEEKLRQKAAVKNQFIQNVQAVLQDKLKAKEFDGIPINPKLAAELQDFLLVDKYKTSSGETLTDFDRMILELKRPENHAMKVKVALLLKTLEKDPTLSTIQKSGITKKSSELFGEVARQQTKGKTTSVQQQNRQQNSWFSH